MKSFAFWNPLLLNDPHAGRLTTYKQMSIPLIPSSSPAAPANTASTPDECHSQKGLAVSKKAMTR